MFETQRFIEDCQTALAGDDSHRAVREVLARAVSAPHEILKDLGDPEEAGFLKLYHSDNLTILNVV
jgi:hypothetical protein